MILKVIGLWVIVLRRMRTVVHIDLTRIIARRRRVKVSIRRAS